MEFDEDKQLIFSLVLQNKETGKGKNLDIVLPAGVHKPREVAKYLKEELIKSINRLVKPEDVQALLNL
jgi:hypothetical protein